MSNTIISDNVIIGFSSTPISISGSGNEIRNNIGYTTENSGTDTSSGDGSSTSLTIAHGLVSTPKYVNAREASSDAATAEIDYTTADSTNITVYFKNALPSGTDNIKIYWEAEV